VMLSRNEAALIPHRCAKQIALAGRFTWILLAPANRSEHVEMITALALGSTQMGIHSAFLLGASSFGVKARPAIMVEPKFRRPFPLCISHLSIPDQQNRFPQGPE